MNSVDVIVPCHNYAHFLIGCVESVLDQTGVDVRVLVLDDASTDDSAAVASALAQRDSRVTVIRHAKNRGHIATYNEGIGWAAADYLLLLSADDYVLPGAFARATELMETNSKVSFTFGSAFLLDSVTGITRLDARVKCSGPSRIIKGYDFIGMSKAICLVNTPTAIVRTALQKRVGGYRPELPHSGDVEMWLRLAAHGPVGYISPPQAVYRHHAKNMSNAYYANGLADFHQREAALNYFFSDYVSRIPHGQRLRKRAAYHLSTNAIDLASLAWETGNAESHTLLDFAFHNSPHSKFSISAVKFGVKRMLGVQRYARLRSLRQRIAPKKVELPEISSTACH